MKKTLMVFIFLGLVSLFADMTYEGARSVLGAYIRVLEGSALAAGAISVAEFLGYLMRFVSGFLADRFRSSKILWSFTIAGYVINLFAVPALAIAGSWEAALALVFLERIGKGLRTPTRDVILSEVTEGIGRGKGFGLYEVMDQIGAVAGPILVGWSVATSGGDYRIAFLILAIPALLSLIFLGVAAYTYPTVRSVKTKELAVGWVSDTRFVLFIVSLSLMTMGYLHWSIISYHMEGSQLVSRAEISFAYALAMGIDALVAFPIGILYDVIGPKSLIITPVAAALIPIALFMNKRLSFYAVAVLWGVVMGIYETNMRAAIPDLVPESKRALAYGIYGLVYGTAWMIGGLIVGYIYAVSSTYLITFTLALEILSLGFLIALISKQRTKNFKSNTSL